MKSAVSQDTMKSSTPLLLVLLLSVSVPPVDASTRGEFTIETTLLQESYAASQSTLSGHLYIANEGGSVYLLTLDAANHQAMISSLPHTGNDTLSSIVERSGEELPELQDRALLYDVLHHTAYIAVDTIILIVHLNTTSLTTYTTLKVPHSVTSIKAFTINSHSYLVVTYTQPQDRGYVQTFRKFGTIWKEYGGPFLVTSPDWYDLNRLSNTLLLQATDGLGDYDTIWVAVAQGYTMYFDNLIESTENSYHAPLHCDNIERMVYSEHRQRMVLQCKESTVLFDASNKESVAIWRGLIGAAYIADSGKYAAVVGRRSLTVLQLSGDYLAIEVNTTRAVVNPLFVDASPDRHFICYTEQVTNTVKCIHIELLFQNTTTEQYFTELFSNSTTSLQYTQAPSFYAHQNMLVLQHTVCSSQDDCVPLLQIFDMLTLTNVLNLTGIEADFLAFKATPFEAPTDATTTSEGPTNSTDQPTTQPSTTERTTTETTTPTVIVETPTTQTEMLMQCSRELQHSNEAYQELLWITIAIGCLFCVAVVVIIALIVVVCITAARVRRVSMDITKDRPEDTPPAYSEHSPTLEGTN